MNKKNRIIIMLVIFIAVIIGFIIYSFFSLRKEIEIEANTNYYTEKEVKDLEYLLKEYYESDHSEKEKRQMAIFNLLKTENEHNYFFTMYDDLEDQIKEIVNSITMDDNYKNMEPYYLNDHLIKRSDYHEIAVSILEDYNSTLHDKNVAKELSRIDEIIVTIINMTSILLYLFTILYFVLIKEYNTKSFIKDIIKYALALILIFAFNIFALFITEKAINYLGVYKVRAFETSHGPNILSYGEIYPLQLLVIFAIGVVMYLLINIKRIKKVS